MKCRKSHTPPRTTDMRERVQAFVRRQNGLSRNARRTDRVIDGMTVPPPGSGGGAAPPFFNVTQHYVKNYLGPTAETLEVLPPNMLLSC